MTATRKTRRCDCCCKIGADDFPYYDATPDNWDFFPTPENPWRIDPGEFVPTGGNSYAIFKTPHPEGADDGRFYVRVFFKLTRDSDQAGIIVNWRAQDSDPPNEAIRVIIRKEITGDCWEMLINSGGSQGIFSSRRIGRGVRLDTWHMLSVCYRPGAYNLDGFIRAKLRLYVPGGVQDWEYGDEALVSQFKPRGARVGLFAQHFNESVRFKRFYFAKMKRCSPAGPTAFDDPYCQETHGICPNCEVRNPNCEIEYDDFDRYDSDDLGCKWIKVAGTSRIKAGTLEFTSGAGAVKLAVVHPKLLADGLVEVDVLLSEYITHQVRLGWSSSYAYGEVTLAGGILTIATGGSAQGDCDTSIGSALPGWATLRVCYEAATRLISATLLQNGAIIAASCCRLDNPVDGTSVGLAHEGEGARFDNFHYYGIRNQYQPSSSCAECLCSESVLCYQCKNGKAAKYVMVDLGAEQPLPGTPPCSDYPRNHFLFHGAIAVGSQCEYSEQEEPELSPCDWIGGFHCLTKLFFTTPTRFLYLTCLVFNEAGDIVVRVDLHEVEGPGEQVVYRWERRYPPAEQPVDCMSWSNLPLAKVFSVAKFCNYPAMPETIFLSVA